MNRVGKPFQKGVAPWNKGKKLTDYPQMGFQKGHIDLVPCESRKKSGEVNSLRLKGRSMPEETRRKISMTLQGKTEWVGYTKSRDHKERRRFHAEMQKLIFERDNYTCQLCGNRGGDLQVDHIQSWAEYVELRFTMNNCRTVCASCHYQITFGRPMPENIKGWGHNLLRKGAD